MKKEIVLKIVLVVLSLATLTGCTSMTTSMYGFKKVEEGYVLQGDKVLVVAKVGFDVDPYKLFNVKESNIPTDGTPSQYSNVIIPFAHGHIDMSADFSKVKGKLFVSSWDQYVVCEIDRSDFISIGGIMYMTGNNSSTNLKFSETIKVKIEENDQFIYVGDLNCLMLNKNELGVRDPQLIIEDDYFNASNALSEFAYNSNGDPIPLMNRLAENSERVSITGVDTEYLYVNR